MSENFENANIVESEVAQLARLIESLGIDPSEIEKVFEQAVLMFGEGRPEHEVEEIFNNYLEAEAKKIAEAEDEADRLAA